MVWRLHRFGRSPCRNLLTIAKELQDRAVELKSLTEAIDTTTRGGRLIFHVVGAVAEFERAIAASGPPQGSPPPALQAATPVALVSPPTPSPLSMPWIKRVLCVPRTHAPPAYPGPACTAASIGRHIRRSAT